MKVLIAEDEMVARMIVQKKVESFGYEVVAVEDGEKALDVLLAEDPPRIAILDWMMPKMDGVSVCRELRERENAPLIYTILLTSRTEQEHLVEALENGAHDFQRKPFDPDELRCRLKIASRLIAAEDKVRTYATRLEALAEERARQLVHADRLASLGTLTAGIIHEINNPVGFISGNAQMQEMMLPHIVESLTHAKESGVGDAKKLEFCLSEFPETVGGINRGVKRLSGIINSMKRFGRESNNDAEPFQINDCIESALLLCNNSLKYNVEIIKEFADDLPALSGRPQRIEQVFVNLFVNAADAMAGTQGGRIAIKTSSLDGGVAVVVEDSGPGIPDALREKIMRPFFTTKAPGKGTGLGLSISKGIIKEHGGTISIDDFSGNGTTFRIYLPSPKE